MQTVAIIGTGISGMSAAHKINGKADLTLYESEMEPGGHTHTVNITGEGRQLPVDTGFMVYNEVTYPLLTSLFRELGVETVETDMSFGVQHKPSGLEYCGSSLSQLFAQKWNLLNPKFINLLLSIGRFNREATSALKDPNICGQTLEAFARSHNFGKSFLDAYLIPMTSAIWSTPPDAMLQFPAQTLFRFMHNHGLLGVTTQHQWRTVKGGSRSYRDKLIKPFKDRIHCSRPATCIRRHEKDVEVIDASGQSRFFDKVVMATHADVTLSLLEDSSGFENQLLGCFKYSTNDITLHTDESVMPANRSAWASWNYRFDCPSADTKHASTHYWMNSLQHIESRHSYFVSVDGRDLIRPETILRQFTFDHPMFDKAAIEAQQQLPKLNQNGRVYFCGSYFRYGFHEDGLMSGYAAAEQLLKHTESHAELPI